MKIKDKVLIVEDEQSISNFISMILTANGYDTIVVRSGGDAMVTVLEGTGRFTVGGEVFVLTEGETLVMPKDVPHAVCGQERFKMLLVVSF